MSDPLTAPLRFADWELMPEQRQLLVRGQPAKLGGRAFDLLCLLARHAGRVVAKEEIFQRVWQGAVVEENNLTVQVTTLRKLLGAGTIATVAGRGYQLAAQPLAAAPPPTPALLAREAELAALDQALAGGARIVSVVGTGGVGKTALARAALARQQGAWRDGLHWIDLAPLEPATPLVPLVAKALQVSIEGLDRSGGGPLQPLAGLQALIVLDNAEHCLDPVAALLELAAQASGVHWIVTSREPVRVAGETVLRLAPLALPAPEASADEAAASGAMQLLCERVRSLDQGFRLDAEGLADAVEICRQLDGLPLALEMAAARVASLGLHGVREQLGQCLRLLVGPRGAPARQMTLGRMLEWSHGLLTPLEQRVFRRLAPFVGGFDAAAAQAVVDLGAAGHAPVAAGDAAMALGALVDKSLLHREAGGSGRLRLLESAREWARDRLHEAGETAAAEARHAQVLGERFVHCDDDLMQLGDRDWIERYAADRHNVRTALRWAAEAGDAALLARMVASLASMDYLMETRAEVLQVPFPAALLAQAPPTERGRALLLYGWAQYADGNREAATEHVTQALADFEACGERTGAYRALTQLVRLYRARPGMEEASRQASARLLALDGAGVPLHARLMCSIVARLPDDGERIARLLEVQALARRAGLETIAAMCSAYLTDSLLIQRQYAAVVETARACVDEMKPRPRSKALVCHNEALALVRLGRGREALGRARAALRAFPGTAPMLVDVFALAAAIDGRWADAAMLAGHGEQVRRTHDRKCDPAEALAVHDTHAALAGALPPDHLADLLQLGAAMSTADALALALGD